MTDLTAKVKQLQRDLDKARFMWAIFPLAMAVLLTWIFAQQHALARYHDELAELGSFRKELRAAHEHFSSRLVVQQQAFETQVAKLNMLVDEVARLRSDIRIPTTSCSSEASKNRAESSTEPQSNEVIVQCVSDVHVTITSHRRQNLQDADGKLRLSNKAKVREQWRLIDAGGGKVFLLSHHSRYLVDKDGKLRLDSHSEPWHIQSAGDGLVFITSHNNQNLQDHNGALRLSANNRRWEKWEIVQQDETAACSFSDIPKAQPMWAMNSTCDADGVGMSCSEVCQAHGRVCMAHVLNTLRSADSLGQIASATGRSCEIFHDHPEVEGVWDGPWVQGNACGYTSSSHWGAACEARPSCGYERVCPCAT